VISRTINEELSNKEGFNSGWSEVARLWKVLPGSKPGPAIGADSNNMMQL
jgi:hypothetical protein